MEKIIGSLTYKKKANELINAKYVNIFSDENEVILRFAFTNSTKQDVDTFRYEVVGKNDNGETVEIKNGTYKNELKQECDTEEIEIRLPIAVSNGIISVNSTVFSDLTTNSTNSSSHFASDRFISIEVEKSICQNDSIEMKFTPKHIQETLPTHSDFTDNNTETSYPEESAENKLLDEGDDREINYKSIKKKMFIGIGIGSAMVLVSVIIGLLKISKI